MQSAQNAYGKVTGGAMAQAIAGEAQRQGVDPGTALTIWSAEGGVTNPATKNPDSSATGIFQHTSGTWSDLGGTDQDRLDASRQVQLGVALTKQNSAALTKDLGRQPQPWEVYLAHQQGLDGAKALLHADPSANAAEVVGNPKAITLNGGTPDTTAGQFINYIKGYVDRHSTMYAANGVPTAQNLKENYEAGLQAVTDLARQEHPGDPTAEQLYRSHYIQQAGQQLHAENMTNQANWSILNAALNGPNAIKSEQDLLANPRLVDAYNAILKTDPSAYRVVNNAINANATAMWDPPASAQTSKLYDTLNGMKDTDRPRFSNLNLMSYYGGMPVAQLNSLIDAQDRIRKNDPTEAAKHTNLISSISAVKDLTIQAAASAESPFYKMDLTSPFLPEQQKWNGFVSKYGQAIDDWQKNNNGKIPTDIQKREIAQGILFPQGVPGSAAEIATLRDRDASPARSSDKSESGAIIIPHPQDTNTSEDANADTNVVNSNSKPDQMVSEQDAGNKGGAALGASRENKGPTAPRVDILVTPRSDKVYDFVAMDNGDNPKTVRGQFNVTTTYGTSEVRPGEYTLSFRPHIDEKSGIAGIKQEIGAMLSGNFSLDVNTHEGNPTLSNTDDWNTIRYKDGTVLGGVMIHQGRDKATGQGGSTLGCFVTDKPTYEQLHQMLLENSNNDGKAYFHLLPRKVSR